MDRRFLLIAGACTGVALSVPLLTAYRSPAASPAAAAARATEDPADIEKTASEVDVAFRAQKQFNGYFNQVLGEVGRGEASLAVAADRLFYYCLVHHPQHLDNLARLKDHQDPKVSLAESLVREAHFRHDEAPAGPWSEVLIARIDRQWQALSGTTDPAATQ